MLAETYATLLNRKIIVPSQQTNHVTLDRDYWLASFSVQVASVDLDEAWYLDKYPDVRDAVGNGTLASARQHYCQSGYFEHRMPYSIAVDEEWYMQEYPDVRQAVQNGDFPSSQAHFEEIGFQEGRLPFANFTLRSTVGRP